MEYFPVQYAPLQTSFQKPAAGVSARTSAIARTQSGFFSQSSLRSKHRMFYCSTQPGSHRSGGSASQHGLAGRGTPDVRAGFGDRVAPNPVVALARLYEVLGRREAVAPGGIMDCRTGLLNTRVSVFDSTKAVEACCIALSGGRAHRSSRLRRAGCPRRCWTTSCRYNGREYYLSSR